MGVGSVPSVPSLALGSGEVTLLSMTSAFATFANDGLVPTPILVRRVETSDGEVLYLDEHVQQRAITEATAFLMAEMLADVVNSGTAWPARREGFMLPAAGKTGTTNDYHDAWFVGFTPHLVDRRVGRLRPAAHDHRPRLRRRARGADVGALHEGSDAQRQGRVVQPSERHHDRAHLPSERQAGDRLVSRRRSGAFARRPTTRTSSPAPSRPSRARSTTLCSPGRSARWRRSSCRSPRPTPRMPPAAPPPQPAVVSEAPPAPKAEAQPAPKKRGFWSRVFGVGKDEKNKKDDRKRTD